MGAIAALLNEYDKAISELKATIRTVSATDMCQTMDIHATDENLKSIQAILTHVVYAGYGFAISIHNSRGHDMTRPPKILHGNVNAYMDDLANMFIFTDSIFNEIGDDEIVQHEDGLKIHSEWGQKYDIEQMMEHAIVQVLRCKRQIEKYKIML